MTDWQPVIGLEVHVQLSTRTKLFCDCANAFGTLANSNTCPICAGHPGVLPVPNEQALLLGVRAALALGCDVQPFSKFDRKHYFYPDLPKGYQISQYDLPFALNGSVDLGDGRRIDLERIHWEEDAGKSTHEAGYSLVDLNRCGVPLIEIVGKPNLHSPADAHAFLDSLKRTLRYATVSTCDMEKGSLRCDANVSLRRTSDAPLGTKVEIKNVNSFKMVERALDFELARQAAILDSGATVAQETRLWDEARGETRSMRSKEEAMDYRYFPEPDIPPIELATSTIDAQRELVAESWQTRRHRYESAGLTAYDASVLTAEPDIADYFEATWQACDDAKQAANWTQTDVLRAAGERGVGIAELRVRPNTLAEIIGLVQSGLINFAGARKVFNRILDANDGPCETPAEAVVALGVAQISDPHLLEPIVREVMGACEKAVADYRKGKTKALDALKGRIMGKTKGRADPAVVGEILTRLLSP